MMKNELSIKGVFTLALLALCMPTWSQQSASASFSQPDSSESKASATVDFSQPNQGASADFKPKHVLKKTSMAAKITKPDPLQVQPDVAVKDVPAKEINLPGVMKIAGTNAQALDFTRSRVIELNNSGSESVYVSANDQNRIQLPWVNPKVIGTDELTIDHSATSNNVYLQFKTGVTRPVQIYFEQPEGGAVLGLQVIPKAIPAQTILVHDTSLLASGAAKAPKSDTYVSGIQNIMETVALGGSPNGFSAIDIKIPPIVMNGLTISTEKLFSSSGSDIYLYDVKNPGPGVVVLKESEFDGPGVLAISIFPKPLLRPNEHVKVIVDASKKGQ